MFALRPNMTIEEAEVACMLSNAQMTSRLRLCEMALAGDEVAIQHIQHGVAARKAYDAQLRSFARKVVAAKGPCSYTGGGIF